MEANKNNCFTRPEHGPTTPTMQHIASAAYLECPKCHIQLKRTVECADGRVDYNRMPGRADMAHI